MRNPRWLLVELAGLGLLYYCLGWRGVAGGAVGFVAGCMFERQFSKEQAIEIRRIGRTGAL